MTVEQSKQFIKARIPTAYAKKYAALSWVIWDDVTRRRYSGYFHTADEAWLDTVTFYNNMR